MPEYLAPYGAVSDAKTAPPISAGFLVHSKAGELKVIFIALGSPDMAAGGERVGRASGHAGKLTLTLSLVARITGQDRIRD